MTEINFLSLKEPIIEKLNTIIKNTKEDGYILCEGFINLPVRQSFLSKYDIGGPVIPSVGIVGNTTGQIYLYALKAILPEIEL